MNYCSVSLSYFYICIKKWWNGLARRLFFLYWNAIFVCCQVIQEHKDRLDAAIVYERDFQYQYFGFKTLERSYLLKIDGKVGLVWLWIRSVGSCPSPLRGDKIKLLGQKLKWGRRFREEKESKKGKEKRIGRRKEKVKLKNWRMGKEIVLVATYK